MTKQKSKTSPVRGSAGAGKKAASSSSRAARARKQKRAKVAPAVGETVVQVSPVEPPLEVSAKELSLQPALKEPALRPESVHPAKHWWLAIAGIGLGVLLLVWTIGNVFLAKMTIGDASVSAITSNAELERLVGDRAASYRLSIVNPNGKIERYSLAQMGMTPTTAETIAKARRAEHQPLQFLEWWRPVSVTLEVKTDNTALASFISEHARIVTQPAQDAKISVVAGKVQITPEVLGRQFGFSNAAGTLRTASQHFSATPLHMTSVALEPPITAHALEDVKKRAESILNQHLEVTIGNKTVTPTPVDIGVWLIITPQATGSSVAVDQSAVQAYMKSVAAANTTAPRSQVVSSKTGAVLSIGAKGVRVGDTAAASVELAAQLLDAKGGTVTLPVTQTAYKIVNAPTAGKWIEVDTGTKRLYAYDQGELVRTFLVSAGASATPTVTGQFAIYSKYRSQDMFGENTDGSSYFQPKVPYVNYFYRDYAIHGNYWRPVSFFGSVNSSHGCVGVQVEESAWIYSWAPIGTPVIVHS